MKNQVSNIHMVGVGGVGMSGIAEMLQRSGYQVSGSDLKPSKLTDRLKKVGVNITFDHLAESVENVDVLVYSSAIDDTNPEIIRAKELRIPIISRAEMLAELMRFQKGIAVAGTHGKTTTTSLLAMTLDEGGYDPTYIVGGILNSISSNVQLGQGEYMVAEADESDASFLQLQPIMAAVTNIDLDHMGTYRDDPKLLHDTFVNFLQHLPFYGLCVMCIDDPGVQAILENVTRRIITYGFSEQADFQIINYQQDKLISTFEVRDSNNQTHHWQLNMPGKHNALNAMVSIIIAQQLGIERIAVARALKKFPGVGRRFTLKSNTQFANKNCTWVDDYAHHPKEIEATWSAATEAWQEERKIMIFQPHRYTRTRDLFNDFISVLSNCECDIMIIAEVYPANEKPITGADGESLVDALRLRGIGHVTFVHDQQELYKVCDNVVQENDIVISMGAGNISSWMEQYSQQ